MLSIVQILEFELGAQCNLGRAHLACPNLSPLRFEGLDQSREMTDAMIINCAVEAYELYDFTGLIGWIYYNEPLLQKERMFRLMEAIRLHTNKARFILWTNGMLIEEDCARYNAFEQIVISGYCDMSLRGARRLASRGVECRYAVNPMLDSRLVRTAPLYPDAPCLRPFVEFIIDHHGYAHWCCYAWRATEVYGNVFDEPFGELVAKWRAAMPDIVGRRMEADAPKCCQACGYRWQRHQVHDRDVLARADAYIREVKRRQSMPPRT
jgi:hypothetical protein